MGEGRNATSNWEWTLKVAEMGTGRAVTVPELAPPRGEAPFFAPPMTVGTEARKIAQSNCVGVSYCALSHRPERKLEGHPKRVRGAGPAVATLPGRSWSGAAIETAAIASTAAALPPCQ